MRLPNLVDHDTLHEVKLTFLVSKLLYNSQCSSVCPLETDRGKLLTLSVFLSMISSL